MTIRDRFARFVLLCGSIATLALVVIVTQRLSDDALSLALGVAVGIVAILVPLVLLLLLAYMLVRWTEARGRSQRSSPPQVMFLPQQTPYQLPAPPHAWAHDLQAARPEREFAVIGGD